MPFEDQAFQLKRDLTAAIVKLVEEFENKTGTMPTSIDVMIAYISSMTAARKIVTGIRLRFDI